MLIVCVLSCGFKWDATLCQLCPLAGRVSPDATLAAGARDVMLFCSIQGLHCDGRFLGLADGWRDRDCLSLASRRIADRPRFWGHVPGRDQGLCGELGAISRRA